MSDSIGTVERLAFDEEFRKLALLHGSPAMQYVALQLEQMTPSRRKRLGFKAKRRRIALTTSAEDA